jgi:hypothetical protein
MHAELLLLPNNRGFFDLGYSLQMCSPASQLATSRLLSAAAVSCLPRQAVHPCWCTTHQSCANAVTLSLHHIMHLISPPEHCNACLRPGFPAGGA